MNAANAKNPVSRYLQQPLAEVLAHKIALVTGPRQCGKTTLARMLERDYQYINYDLAEHRQVLRDKSWDRQRPLIILDELHKMHGWKAWLKGIYDAEGLPPALLVTGSARLDAFRKTGDSLAGRHFLFRLHPLDLQEVLQCTDLGANGVDSADEALHRLLTVGGFPEPLFKVSKKGDRSYYNRWRRSHLDLILREDLISLTAIRDIQAIETLVEMLRHHTGSLISAHSLARDLGKNTATVNRWLGLLEDLYILFRIRPWHRNVGRSLLKMPKCYFYDTGMVEGTGARLENLVACALLKAVHRATDVDGDPLSLHFVRNKEGRELDFLIAREQTPIHLIEVKQSDADPSSHFRHLLAGRPVRRTQVVGDLTEPLSFPDGTRVEPAARFLANLYPDIRRSATATSP